MCGVRLVSEPQSRDHRLILSFVRQGKEWKEGLLANYTDTGATLEIGRHGIVLVAYT